MHAVILIPDAQAVIAPDVSPVTRDIDLATAVVLSAKSITAQHVMTEVVRNATMDTSC